MYSQDPGNLHLCGIVVSYSSKQLCCFKSYHSLCCVGALICVTYGCVTYTASVHVVSHTQVEYILDI